MDKELKALLSEYYFAVSDVYKDLFSSVERFLEQLKKEFPNG